MPVATVARSPDGGQETVEHRRPLNIARAANRLAAVATAAQGTATTAWDASHFL